MHTTCSSNDHCDHGRWSLKRLRPRDFKKSILIIIESYVLHVPYVLLILSLCPPYALLILSLTHTSSPLSSKDDHFEIRQSRHIDTRLVHCRNLTAKCRSCFSSLAFSTGESPSFDWIQRKSLHTISGCHQELPSITFPPTVAPQLLPFTGYPVILPFPFHCHFSGFFGFSHCSLVSSISPFVFFLSHSSIALLSFSPFSLIAFNGLTPIALTKSATICRHPLNAHCNQCHWVGRFKCEKAQWHTCRLTLRWFECQCALTQCGTCRISFEESKSPEDF